MEKKKADVEAQRKAKLHFARLNAERLRKSEELRRMKAAAEKKRLEEQVRLEKENAERQILQQQVSQANSIPESVKVEDTKKADIVIKPKEDVVPKASDTESRLEKSEEVKNHLGLSFLEGTKHKKQLKNKKARKRLKRLKKKQAHADRRALNIRRKHFHLGWGRFLALLSNNTDSRNHFEKIKREKKKDLKHSQKKRLRSFWYRLGLRNAA